MKTIGNQKAHDKNDIEFDQMKANRYLLFFKQIKRFIFTTQTIDKITWALYKNKDGRDYVSTWSPSKVIKWMNNQQFENAL